MNCACMSVGNAGYGAVVRLTAFGRLPCMSRVMVSSVVSIFAPASTSLDSTASMVFGRARLTVTLPPVIAAATRKVPVSMRSGSTSWRPPDRRSTPSITRRAVPRPSIFAPSAIRQCARSVTSGSIAQLSRMVVPSASTAPISTFSVPVTLTMSKVKCPPFSRFAVALMKPFSTTISAPSACRPLMCWSTGREPIAQPPGSDTSAAPKRASSGPSTRIEARMVLTSSYGATCWLTERGSTTIALPRDSVPWSMVTLAPSSPSSFTVVTTSCRCGTLVISTGASASRVAQRMGRTAFLAPEMLTSPCSAAPPVTTILAMYSGSSAVQPASAGVTVFSASAWIAPPIRSPRVA